MIEIASVEFISSVGFPIAACVYLAFRFEAKLDENTKMIQSLKDVITRLGKEAVAREN